MSLLETFGDDGSSSADGDEDFAHDCDDSSEHSQDWAEAHTKHRGHGRKDDGQLADSQQQSNTSTRRGKRKAAYTEEERRYRRRLANRESARRMRAKRSEEVKELETTVVHLKDKNKQLERQNKEYAKSLQHLQEEMLSLKTQLQQNLAVSKQQQQQSSSEMHQVLSCGTTMHPQQQQLLLQTGSNMAAGMCFSGQVSFSGAINSMPNRQVPAAPPASEAQQQHDGMLAAQPVQAAAGTTLSAGASLEDQWQQLQQQQRRLQQQQQLQMYTFGSSSSQPAASALKKQQQLLQQLQSLQQQAWQQAQVQQQQQHTSTMGESAGMRSANAATTGSDACGVQPAWQPAVRSSPFAAAAWASADRLHTLGQQQQELVAQAATAGEQQQQGAFHASACAQSAAEFSQHSCKQEQGPDVASAFRTGQVPQVALPRQQEAASAQQPVQAVADTAPQQPVAVVDPAAAAGAAVCGPVMHPSGLFPAAAEELLNELLMTEENANQAQALEPATAAQAAAAAAAAGRAADADDFTAVHGIQQQNQEQVRPSSGFRRWSPEGQQQQAASNRLAMLGQAVTAQHGPGNAFGLPAAWHGLLQQQAALQTQPLQQQQQQVLPAVGGIFAGQLPQSEPQRQQQCASLQPGPVAVAAGGTTGQAHAAGTASADAAAAAATAATAASMLAARGRAFAAGFGNQGASFCGFEIPDVQPAPAPMPQRAAAPAPAAAASVPADHFETWARRFVPPAAAAAVGSKGATAGVLDQLGSALQLELPESAGMLRHAAEAAAPDAAAAAEAAARGLPAQTHPLHLQQQQRQRRSSGSDHHHQHSSLHHVQAEADGTAARKSKRRFPLKRPSRLAAQQAALVAAAATAVRRGDARATSTACQGSCGPDWLAAGTAMQLQLEQQKRRRQRKMVHAGAAPVGEDAVRITSCSSRVGGQPAPTGDYHEDEIAAAAAAATAAAAAALTGDDAALHGAAANGAEAGSPTSRPRVADAMQQQHSGGLWALPAHGAEGVCLQGHSSMGQRKPAFSVPGNLALPHQGPASSLCAADGCRSYASEPGVDAEHAAATAGSVLDWAEGCSAALDQWGTQLMHLQQHLQQQPHQQPEGLQAPLQGGGVAGAAAVDGAAAGRAGMGMMQCCVEGAAPYAAEVSGLLPGGGDLAAPSAARVAASPRAVAVLNAAAAVSQAQQAGAAGPSLSPQLQQLQQQLQEYVQRSRGVKAQQQYQQQQPLQQQQTTSSAGYVQHLQQQVGGSAPGSAGGSGDLDHAVPDWPAAGCDLQQQQQQQPQLHEAAPDAPAAAAAVCVSAPPASVISSLAGLAASGGPAAAAVQASSVSALPCCSAASHGTAASSPKGPADGFAALLTQAPASEAGAGPGQAAELQSLRVSGSMAAATSTPATRAGSSAGLGLADAPAVGVCGAQDSAAALGVGVVGAAGLDIGDLDVPDSPPELDALLAEMLQQEGLDDRQAGGGEAHRQQQELVSGLLGRSSQPCGTCDLDLQLQGLAGLSCLPTGAQQGIVKVENNAQGQRQSGSQGPASAAAGAATGPVGHAARRSATGTADGSFLQQQLTEASAGLQGLWLDPATTGPALLQNPTGLGFSVGGTLPLAGSLPSSTAGAAADAAAAGGGSSSGLWGWQAGQNPGSLALPLPASLLGLPVSAGGFSPAQLGAAGMHAAVQEGSSDFMAAAAAAAGFPPWSAWQEEQQQWLDDIFSSGPTLPHEPCAPAHPSPGGNAS